MLMHNYKLFFLSEAVLLIVSGLSFFTFYESPAYLYSINEYEKLKNVLFGILSINYKNDEKVKEMKKKEVIQRIDNLQKIAIHKEAQKGADIVEDYDMTLEVQEKPKVALKILGFIIVIANVYVVEGILFLIPQEMGIDNIYLNGSLLGMIDLVTYATLISVVHKMKRRASNLLITFGFILIGLTSIAIYNLNLRETPFGKYTEVSLSLLSKCLMCVSFVFVFNYGTELFDIRYRGIAIGLSIFIGRLSMSSSAVLIDIAHRFNIHPITGILSMAFFAFISAYYLPETLEQE